MGSVKNRIGDSQLTIEGLRCYKPLEIERSSFAHAHGHRARGYRSRGSGGPDGIPPHPTPWGPQGGEGTPRRAARAASERAAGGPAPRALWAASVVRQPRRRALLPWARRPVGAARLLRGGRRRV